MHMKYFIFDFGWHYKDRIKILTDHYYNSIIYLCSKSKNTFMESIQDLRLAVLIDADNVPYRKVKLMFEEIAKYGSPTFKRIYADWTKPTVSGWKTVLLENAITPIQQYSYSVGKNSS